MQTTSKRLNLKQWWYIIIQKEYKGIEVRKSKEYYTLEKNRQRNTNTQLNLTTYKELAEIAW